MAESAPKRLASLEKSRPGRRYSAAPLLYNEKVWEYTSIPSAFAGDKPPVSCSSKQDRGHRSAGRRPPGAQTGPEQGLVGAALPNTLSLSSLQHDNFNPQSNSLLQEKERGKSHATYVFHVQPFTALLPDSEFFKQPPNNPNPTPRVTHPSLPGFGPVQRDGAVEQAHDNEGSGAVKRTRINCSHKFNEPK